MGVLKNITNEYFGESARTEDGKVTEIFGHKVVVPKNFGDQYFMEKVQQIFTIGRIATKDCFLKDDEINKLNPAYIIVIGTDSEYSLVINTYKVLKNGFFTHIIMKDIEESTFNDVVDFLSDMLSKRKIVERGVCFGIPILSEDEIVEKISEPLMAKHLGRQKFERCLKAPFKKFAAEFDEVLKSGKPKSKFLGYFDTEKGVRDVVVTICKDRDSNMNFDAIALSDKMIKWWERELNTIEKDGVDKYFNLE